jgi:hypothetical protein
VTNRMLAALAAVWTATMIAMALLLAVLGVSQL